VHKRTYKQNTIYNITYNKNNNNNKNNKNSTVYLFKILLNSTRASYRASMTDRKEQNKHINTYKKQKKENSIISTVTTIKLQ
jgi:hypothetical protein